ncbi:MFS transporter [Aestuariimicrobium sp. T2.26MG-19.2B]|uniref:MFS transporter n=1 Tax=Aestuariimicrobium sp. T2.26MG-19.2B TaxID=3040679 RepID=UPI00247798D2|nr:MFS transporter [Aestuariimicrobium sp. T2.26MG-19.2B]CAI9403494.1 Inner membrane protein YbjJ [Aestuariimicrobium sp. T2.26MG-19.2B]
MSTPQLDRHALVNWRNAIITAFALGGVASAAFGARLPSIQADLGVSKGTLGTMLIGTTVGALAGLASSAWIHRTFGARTGIRTSLFIVAAGVALIGLGAGALHSPVMVILALALTGYGIGSLDVMINVEGSMVERQFRKTLMPLMHAAWSAGVIVGAGIGAGSAALGLPVEYQLPLQGALVAAGGWVLSWGVPSHEAPETPAEKVTWGERARGILASVKDVRLVLIGLVMLGSELGEGSANNWLTLAVRTEHLQPEAIAGLFLVLFAASETLARALGGPVVDRIGRARAVRVTSVLGLAGIALFILTDHWLLVAVGVLLWAFGVSMGFPLGMSAAADSGPNPAARVSFVAVIGYAANLTGPPAIGNLADHVGLLKALWVIAALFAVAVLCASAVRKEPEPVHPADDQFRLAAS